MQGLWYGDRRDRVKWGALLQLTQTRKISCVVQVAYFRHGEDPVLQTPEGDVTLPAVVWNHFSNLRHIERLGEAAEIEILVLAQPFDPRQRRRYVADVVARLCTVETPKIVFLDPDTGMAPSTSGPQHVTQADAAEIWGALSVGDLLVVYQHGDRTTTWRDDRASSLSAACSGAPVQVIAGKGVASDVAMLWCEKR